MSQEIQNMTENSKRIQIPHSPLYTAEQSSKNSEIKKKKKKKKKKCFLYSALRCIYTSKSIYSVLNKCQCFVQQC